MSRLSALNYKTVQFISCHLFAFLGGLGEAWEFGSCKFRLKKGLYSPHLSSIPHPQQVPVMELRCICCSSLTSGFTNGCGYYLAVCEGQESQAHNFHPLDPLNDHLY